MEWGFLTALGGVKEFPLYGIIAYMVWTIMSAKWVSAKERDDALARLERTHAADLERLERTHLAEVQRISADRDDRLESKNDEIARLIAGFESQLTRVSQERDDWRAAWLEGQGISAEVRSQNRDLIDSLYYVRKVVGALPSVKGGDTE